jgi:hypothetical protein
MLFINHQFRNVFQNIHYICKVEYTCSKNFKKSTAFKKSIFVFHIHMNVADREKLISHITIFMSTKTEHWKYHYCEYKLI